MPVLAFMSEPFSLKENKYLTNKPSINFVRSCFDNKLVAVGYTVNKDITNPSGIVAECDFEWIYGYNSIFDFVFKIIKNPFFLYKYIVRCDQLLKKYSEFDIWIRNPSIGCLIFSLRAIKYHNGDIYNHMCANAINAWNSSKYPMFIKPFAYVFSLILKMLIIKVVSHKKIINLCTGSELESFCREYNENTFQLIDTNIKSCEPSIVYSGESFTFTFIGRVQKDKGVSELLEAFIRLCDNTSIPVFLNIVGDGLLLNNLKERYGGFNNVEFLGAIPNDQIGRVLSKTHAVVVPSNNGYEGFPRVILEAWSFGLPVVVSNVGGIKGLVKHGYNGFVFSHKKCNLLKYMKKIIDCSEYGIIKQGVAESQIYSVKEYWISHFKSIKTYEY